MSAPHGPGLQASRSHLCSATPSGPGRPRCPADAATVGRLPPQINVSEVILAARARVQRKRARLLGAASGLRARDRARVCREPRGTTPPRLPVPPRLLLTAGPVLAFCPVNLAVVIMELLLSAADRETATSPPKKRPRARLSDPRSASRRPPPCWGSADGSCSKRPATDRCPSLSPGRRILIPQARLLGLAGRGRQPTAPARAAALNMMTASCRLRGPSSRAVPAHRAVSTAFRPSTTCWTRGPLVTTDLEHRRMRTGQGR